MKLSDLIKNIEYTSVSGSADIDTTAVCYDSRKASEGSVFVCITGFATDGHKYAASAVEKGAVALIAEHEIENIPENVTVVICPNTRKALAFAAAEFYGHPSDKMRLVGVRNKRKNDNNLLN